MKSAVLVCFILSVFLSGCLPEERSGIAPEVKISVPVASQSFGYLDTVFVNAVITHPESLESIQVSIVNEQSLPILPSRIFHPDGPEYVLKTWLIFDNILTESAVYYVQVRALSGSEETTGQIRISYSAEPKLLESVLAVTRKDGNQFGVTDVPASGIPHERFSYSGDYIGSAVNSAYQLFFTAGSVSSGLTAWDLSEDKIRWDLTPVTSPPLPLYTAVYADENTVYTAGREAFIYGYAVTGLNTFRSERFTNGYFTRIIRYKSWVIAVFEPFSSNLNKLVVFNYPGGTVFEQLQFEGHVQQLAAFDDHGLLVFLNEGSSSAVFQFDPVKNAMIRLRQFQQGEIICVSMPGADNAFLSFSDGVYWYRPSNGSFVKVVSGGGIASLAFDEETEQLFTADRDQLKAYSFPEFQPVASCNLGDSILDIHLHYTK